ncbi:MAG: hypothetical protein K1X74_16460 [Pirellulales bacterium]|nr:hypothetical protein [Pirellulales bacterium]
MTRRIHAWLFVVTLVLPIAVVLCVGVARLLAAVGDTAGGVGLERVALGLGMLWVLCLVGLVLVQSLHLLNPPPPPRHPPGCPPQRDEIDEL